MSNRSHQQKIPEPNTEETQRATTKHQAEGHAFTRAIKSRAEWRYRSAEGRSAGAAETTKKYCLCFFLQKPQQNRMSSPKTT
jgi:hypothetical protein